MKLARTFYIHITTQRFTSWFNYTSLLYESKYKQTRLRIASVIIVAFPATARIQVSTPFLNFFRLGNNAEFSFTEF